jgi:SPP1 gp7 family putative phage head morphogenesis protein
MDNTIRSALITVIKSHRQKMSRSQRQRSVKPQRWLYPYATEVRYAAIIRTWLRPMKEYVHNYLKENQEAILHGDSADFLADSDSISVLRFDVMPGKSFKRMIDSLNGWLGQYVPDDDESKSGSPIYLGLGKIADSTFDFNEGQYEKGAKTVLGVEFPVGEDWWPGARENWKRTNYELLRGQMLGYIHSVNDLTEKAVTGGWSVGQLSKQIMALDQKITKGKANFIARDQIGKLNGEITQRRMESIGLTMYIWETSGDERVRPSHEMMDGGLCRWDDSAVFSQDGGKTWIPRPSGAVVLHPGQDYQCRCTAIAYWHELVEEVDDMIAQYEELDALSAQNIAAMPKTALADDSTEKRIQDILKNKVNTEQKAVELGNMLLDKAEREKRDIFDVMRGYREFGTDQKHPFAKGSSKDGITRIQQAGQYYPTDWLKISIKSAKDTGLKTSIVSRGSYSQIWDKDRQKYIPIIRLSKRQYCEIHEMAHRMELLIPQIVNIEREFYERRTANENLTEIRKLPGYERSGYGTNEKTRIDKFAHPYMGKYYNGTVYEILSMGIENLKTKEYNTDREYNAFIVGVLTGVK